MPRHGDERRPYIGKTDHLTFIVHSLTLAATGWKTGEDVKPVTTARLKALAERSCRRIS
jgi:hypothetical protein